MSNTEKHNEIDRKAKKHSGKQFGQNSDDQSDLVRKPLTSDPKRVEPVAADKAASERKVKEN